MSFATYSFVLVFLPAVFLIYFLAGKITRNSTIQKLILILASFYFYGYTNMKFIPYLVISVVVNYGFAQCMRRYAKRRQIFFLTAIIMNVAELIYFKYINFFLDTYSLVMQSETTLIKLIVPLGISFITFTQILFLIQVWKQKIVEMDFISYCLFVVFFPKIISGPICSYTSMRNQLEEKVVYSIQFENVLNGLLLFVIGLFKKVVIADSLVLYVNNGFSLGEYGTVAAWITSLFYTLQIYFDFSGYSDMALGIAYFFNLRLPVNFNSPYQAKGIIDFWKRWHITLSQTLTEILYIPLGGNRRGQIRTYVNVFIVFLVSGFWHGAAWTFILWGILHGIANIIERLLQKFGRNLKYFQGSDFIKQMITFCCVNIAWVFFRAENTQKAFELVGAMFSFQTSGLGQLNSIMYDGIFTFPPILNIGMAFLILCVLLGIVFFGRNSNEIRERFIFNKKGAVMLALLFMISLIHMSRLSTFIYAAF